jgi:O-antigen/teichoic acid export membrane protein
MAVVSLLWPRGGDIDLRDLIWVAPFLPMLLLHDTGRYSYLAARRPDQALVIDLIWVSTQGLAVVVMILAGLTSAGGLFVCWGLGATAGAIVFAVRSRIAGPGWRSAGGPRRWFAQTRYLSGWFTATALIGQFSVQLASFLVAALLSPRGVSGFRAAQTALLQPVQNFITAMMGLLVPRASRLAGDAARLPGAKGVEAATALRRQTVRLALAFAGLALLMIVIVVPIARTVLVHIPKFADIAPLALPTAIQAGLFLVQLPFTSAMRGMHRAPMLFLQYALFTTSSMSGLAIGAHLNGLPGAVWGLASGAAVGLAVMIGLYAYSLRWLGNADAERFAHDDVLSGSP